MTAVLPTIVDLARRILAIEAARSRFHAVHENEADTQVDEAVRVCANLQTPLSRLTGPAGFWSLLSRALVLTKAEAPSLKVVQIRPDGTLAGFDQIEHDQDAGEFEKGRVVLVAQLLGLLAIFIGESLTRRLVCDTWPEANEGNEPRPLGSGIAKPLPNGRGSEGPDLKQEGQP